MRFLIFLIFLCLIASLCSCEKQDYSYLNTDRTGCKTFVRLSKRFTWTWDSITTVQMGWPERCCDSAVIWNENYRDTLYWDPAKCPAPVSSMPDFRIEIRCYEEVKTK
jgi:hypothetical protein